MRGDYQRPCLNMFNSVVWNWLYPWNGQNNDTFVQVFYVEKYFEEITQTEGFGFSDFWSNVGGNIGIFVGYSMMQIPELICKQRMYNDK